MSTYKPYMATFTVDQIEWIKKCAKEFKIKPTEFMRTLIEFVKMQDIKDLKQRVFKSRLESALEEIQVKEKEIMLRKQSIEKELEKVTA